MCSARYHDLTQAEEMCEQVYDCEFIYQVNSADGDMHYELVQTKSKCEYINKRFEFAPIDPSNIRKYYPAYICGFLRPNFFTKFMSKLFYGKNIFYAKIFFAPKTVFTAKIFCAEKFLCQNFLRQDILRQNSYRLKFSR